VPARVPEGSAATFRQPAASNAATGVREGSSVRRKILLSILALILLGGITAYALRRPERTDTRHTGAYVLEDGTQVFIAPREGKVLRYRMLGGETGLLWPAGPDRYQGGAGWAEREPVINEVRFQTGAGGQPSGFAWQRASGEGGAVSRQARRLDLPERIFRFPSGDLTLRGKLVLPAGEGPFPVVVLVHGSEPASAVDHYYQPYLYAANGLAALAFDKRGTGESDGQYLQNFQVLAGDVAAAVRYLRTQKEIDAQRIHLAGFSQGGWIAPLAALQDGGIRSILIGYGVALPVTAEDRWGYVYALQQKGFGPEAIAAADRINEVIEDIIDRRLNRWSELGEMLAAARSEPWFEAVKGSDSMLGLFAGTKLPPWAMRVGAWWLTGADGDPPYIDRTYDPVPTLRQLSVPSLWLLAGADSSAPTEWTVAELQKLQADGAPIQYFVYPQAEHGILRFVQEQGGERRLLGHESDYHARQLQWLRSHSGL
jgi:uncharacterized protein